jgi:tRNA(fMet)-specific endonuclease VapC
MRYLLDTCVVSELVARDPNQQVIDWIDGVDPEAIYLSVITIGEIRKGIEKLADSKRKSMLQQWLEDELLVRFSGRILPIDSGVMLTWGQMIGRLELSGKKMAAMDSLIAAIVSHANLILVTRNEGDFQHSGVQILNPWKA